ncbi:MAG TPA: ADP-ribosylglycohydrolase family protein [bacterium]|mgnify:FL=1|nr:ADP-ribosylglycohydrolase family protein [bacterium]
MDRLFDRIYGCLAGAFIGSAMGAAVEGWSWQDIKAKYGVLQELLPYSHYKHINKPGSGRLRPPGTTEDGVERIKLLALSIGEKGGRITAKDLGATWLKYINPDNFGVQMEPCDEILYNVVASGIHPAYAGLYTDFLGIISFARSCHPVGLVNACNPEEAYKDVWDVGRLYQPLHGGGLDWASVVACSIAYAMNPDATVDGVLDTALRYAPSDGKYRLEVALDLAQKSQDPFELREKFDTIYSGKGIRYSFSWGEEVVPKGLAIFYVTKGDLRSAIIGGVNFGRDTDCCAAIASGIAGAFSGVSGIPSEWIEQVDKAAKENEYTVSQLTIKENAELIYKALMNEKEKIKNYVKFLER